MMYELVSYKIVYPSFNVEQIATPISGTGNNPLYNTTSLQTIPLVILPSGGKYSFQFSDSTFLQLTLGTFTINKTNVYPSELNQDLFYQQSYNTNQPLSSTAQVNGYQVSSQVTETLYLEGDSFTVDTTNLSKSQLVTVSLPTYIQLQVGSEAYNSQFNTNVSLVYPVNSFYVNSSIINPQNWIITSPFGIQYTVAVSNAPGSMYTVGFNIVDLYGNQPEFTINGYTVPNSVFDSVPTINQDYVPELPSSEFANINPMQMYPDGVYNYGNFSTTGTSDGLDVIYPVLFNEQIGYAIAENNNNQTVYYSLRAYSVASGKNGIKLYGLIIGSQPLVGYTTPLMVNLYLTASQSSNVTQTLQSNGYILPTLLSSSTGSPGGLTGYSSSSSAMSSSNTSSTSTSTNTTTSTTTSTTTTTNTSKTNISLMNLFTSPLAILIIILALIGVILFIAI